MPHLICYDIAGNPLRAKLGKKIIESGLDRINKSVYLGTISASSLTSLENQLAKLLKDKGEPDDSLIIIEVTLNQVDNMRIYGSIDPDIDELKGEKGTLLM
jgi:CRISPR-associated protein Cas2